MTMMMMDHDAVCAYAQAKPGATEDYPFGPEHRVLKVGGKMFALFGGASASASAGESGRVSLKCDPERVPLLRATYAAITFAAYMDKRHWNAVVFDGSVPDDLLRELVDESYALVVKGLPRRVRETLPPTDA